MKSSASRYPLINLPSQMQVTLFLIQEELKSRKLFQTFREIGFDECDFRPHLDPLILQSVGLDDDSDATFDIYTNILERRARKITTEKKSITKQAMKVYHELMAEKKKLSVKKER